jgi:cytochrome P450
MLRFESIVIQFRRTALVDTVIGSTPIRSGDKVVVFFPSANRDEAVFDRPDTFDITRSPNQHLAFGHGTHFCLGAPLARMEARHLFHELFSRICDVEPVAELAVGKTNFVRSVHRQPIAYRPRSR